MTGNDASVGAHGDAPSSLSLFSEEDYGGILKCEELGGLNEFFIE
jgi:hypothetical protein